MHIRLIAAMDANQGIGYQNALPWHIPKDFLWFKEHTVHKTVLMGRKCYEDILGHTKGKPLPQRTNIVLSTQPHFSPAPEFLHATSVEHALQLASQSTTLTQGQSDLMIIGGAQIYALFLPFADELILTHIHKTYPVDTFFPKVDWSAYLKIYEHQDTQADLSFTFARYQKRKST